MPKIAHPIRLSAISGHPPIVPKPKISPISHQSMTLPRSTVSPSRTPLLFARDSQQEEESDERKMKFLCLDTERWTRDDIRRTITFVSAVLVGLGSGSNYVYSAYAPQLAEQLTISSTQVNLVGTAGNLGMYLMGPLWGKLTDTRGARIPLFIGGTLVFTGYSLVRAFFLGYIPIRPNPSADPSTTGMAFLCLSMFLSGCGGAAGLTAAVNAVAKSFSDKTRATASGMVLAGFGLSAFTFSTIGHLLFSGDAGGLLLLLALGCSAPMLLGSLIIKEVSPRGESGYERVADGPEIIFSDEQDESYHTRTSSIELSRSRSPAPVSRHAHHQASAVPKRRISSIPSAPGTGTVDFSPMQLIYNIDFYALCAVLAICCGTGLMYINNVGTVALALGRNGHLEYDAHEISSWQAKQVATISIYNCAGRILAGIASDWAKARFGIGRIWFLPVVACMFIVSQFTAMGTTHVEHLWIVSTILGMAYGSLFNVIPILVLEWFGMAHFSQNFGTINLAPILGGNLFNLLFGYVYDSNTIGRIGMPESEKLGGVVRMLVRSGGAVANDDQHACLLGEACYGLAFKMTTFGCFIALAISLAAGFRRAKDSKLLSVGAGRSAEV